MKYFLLTGLLYSFMLPTHAGEHPGKILHDKNCMGCHDTSMYTRSNRRVGSIGALTTQVKRCDSSLETQWFDEDIKAVAEYLDLSFYKFDKKVQNNAN